jgi:hypothetical protein
MGLDSSLDAAVLVGWWGGGILWGFGAAALRSDSGRGAGRCGASSWRWISLGERRCGG